MAAEDTRTLQIRKVLEPAEGYLELGLHQDAWVELDGLLP